MWKKIAAIMENWKMDISAVVIIIET